MSKIHLDIIDRISQLKTILEDYRNSINGNIINEKFVELIRDTLRQKRWYDEGKCYICGGRIKTTHLKPDSMNVSFECRLCHKKVFDDVPFDYYFESIIDKILKLAEEFKIE